MTKSKTSFEILVKKAFRWHLEIWKNQIGSIFKLNVKKCQIPKKKFAQVKTKKLEAQVEPLTSDQPSVINSSN